MGDGHSVLGQGASLVRADGGGGSQGLDSLQILDQAVLGCHPLGGQGQAHGDGGQKTLGDVGDNDTNQEDVGIEPVVTKDVGDSSDEVDNISGRQLGTPERAASEASWLTSLFKTGTTDSPV